MIEALSEEKQYTYLSTLTHYVDIADRRAIENEYEVLILRLMKELAIVPFKDGNKWCALYGEDLQVGIAGFGDTPFMAMVDLRNKIIITKKLKNE